MTPQLEQLGLSRRTDPETAEVEVHNGHMKATALRSYEDQRKEGIGDEQIAEYLPLVSAIARKVASYCRPPLSFEDLVSAGTVGLLKAARDYDGARQVQFKTYAYIRIKGAILDELRSASMLPTAVNRQVKQAQEVSRQIAEETGRPPRDEELADRLQLSMDELHELFDSARAQRFLSLDSPDPSGRTMAESLMAPVEGGPTDALEKAELIDRLGAAIAELDEKRRHIVLLYYQQHLTMKQVADVLGITESRVSQLHASALFHLSAKLKDWNHGHA